MTPPATTEASVGMGEKGQVGLCDDADHLVSQFMLRAVTGTMVGRARMMTTRVVQKTAMRLTGKSESVSRALL